MKGLTANDFLVLYAVSRYKKGVRRTRLLTSLSINPNSVQRSLLKLRKAGLINSKQQENRRGSPITLKVNKKGKELVKVFMKSKYLWEV